MSMYNRYIPQPDGSYRRDRIQDPAPHHRPQPRPTPPPPPDSKPEPKPDMPKVTVPPCRQNTDAGDFLRRLLPRNIDTGDLMVILLLLLMAGDSADDKNTALLTLVLYLFM